MGPTVTGVISSKVGFGGCAGVHAWSPGEVDIDDDMSEPDSDEDPDEQNPWCKKCMSCKYLLRCGTIL